MFIAAWHRDGFNLQHSQTVVSFLTEVAHTNIVYHNFSQTHSIWLDYLAASRILWNLEKISVFQDDMWHQEVFQRSDSP